MPKENIERAVKRALGKEVGMMDEVRYEGFGPGGFSCLIIAATDNKQRTSAEIRHLFEKHAGNLGDSGAVAYQFALCGFILAQKEGRSLDEMFLIAADCGAEDVEDAGDSVIIYTKPDDLGNARDELIKKGVNVSEAKLIYKPTILMPITDPEKAKAAISFISSLEEHPDVQEVFTNLEIPDELIV
jgi:YebC/PmpR family DNA-binding regulatory protein